MSEEFDLVSELAPSVPDPDEQLLSDIKRRSGVMTNEEMIPSGSTSTTPAGATPSRWRRPKTFVAAAAASGVLVLGGVAAADLLFDVETGTALAAQVQCEGEGEPIIGAANVAEAIDLCAEARGIDSASLEANLIPGQNRVVIALPDEDVIADGQPMPREDLIPVARDIEFDPSAAETIGEIANASWSYEACVAESDAIEVLETRLSASGMSDWTVSVSDVSDLPIDGFAACAAVEVEPASKRLVVVGASGEPGSGSLWSQVSLDSNGYRTECLTGEEFLTRIDRVLENKGRTDLPVNRVVDETIDGDSKCASLEYADGEIVVGFTHYDEGYLQSAEQVALYELLEANDGMDPEFVDGLRASGLYPELKRQVLESGAIDADLSSALDELGLTIYPDVIRRIQETGGLAPLEN